jgi:molybdopterin/thiamine biosynthesis adenylyltransferase
MSLERYSKQILFRDIREAGQRKICGGRVLVCGCGALGSALADGLTRAGVGFLRIVDRDFVEISNLQRQVLFDEEDVRSNLPKAIAAGRKLAKINSEITIEPVVADIDHTNILDFARDVDLFVDGMDNFETRFLMNDAALELRKPWVYGGCIGSHGQTMAIFPGETACLQCLIEAPPGPGAAETCDTAGVLAPIISVIASLQIVDALKILSGRRDLVSPVLTVVDVWDGTFRRMNMANVREQAQCAACVGGQRDWLHGHKGSQTTVLCGRNAVQISPSERVSLSLPELAERFKSSGEVSLNPFLVRLNVTGGEHQLTVFPDGRAIIKGTPDPAVARTLYARYVGT